MIAHSARMAMRGTQRDQGSQLNRYRIESNQPIVGRLWPAPGERQVEVRDRALAVTVAAKSYTAPGSEIRVVHVLTHEVVFRKPAAEHYTDA